MHIVLQQLTRHEATSVLRPATNGTSLALISDSVQTPIVIANATIDY